MNCPTCKGTGRIVVVEFDGRYSISCPDCTPNPVRARLAAEFGTEEQRRRIAAQRKGNSPR